MAYTVLINNDNSATATIRERIMQRTKNVDCLHIIIPKIYNGTDFTSYSVLMEYKLPISHEVKLEELVLADDKYKDDYNLYRLKLGTEFTKEPGNVEIQLTLISLEMDADGNTIESVRHISPFIVPINEVADWFNVPDSELTTLTQYYLAAKQEILALNDIANTLDRNKADDIKLDVESGEVYLVSGSKRIGTGISVEELGNEIVERTTDGTVKLQNN